MNKPWSRRLAFTAALKGNHSFSQIAADRVAGMLREVAASKPQAIVTCTNFPAAPIVGAMERELGIPVYDTVTRGVWGVWGVLSMLGLDTRPGRAWGRVFER